MHLVSPETFFPSLCSALDFSSLSLLLLQEPDLVIQACLHLFKEINQGGDISFEINGSLTAENCAFGLRVDAFQHPVLEVDGLPFKSALLPFFVCSCSNYYLFILSFLF